MVLKQEAPQTTNLVWCSESSTICITPRHPRAGLCRAVGLPRPLRRPPCPQPTRSFTPRCHLNGPNSRVCRGTFWCWGLEARAASGLPSLPMHGGSAEGVALTAPWLTASHACTRLPGLRRVHARLFIEMGCSSAPGRAPCFGTTPRASSRMVCGVGRWRLCLARLHVPGAGRHAHAGHHRSVGLAAASVGVRVPSVLARGGTACPWRHT